MKNNNCLVLLALATDAGMLYRVKNPEGEIVLRLVVEGGIPLRDPRYDWYAPFGLVGGEAHEITEEEERAYPETGTHPDNWRSVAIPATDAVAFTAAVAAGALARSFDETNRWKEAKKVEEMVLGLAVWESPLEWPRPEKVREDVNKEHYALERLRCIDDEHGAMRRPIPEAQLQKLRVLTEAWRADEGACKLFHDHPMGSGGRWTLALARELFVSSSGEEEIFPLDGRGDRVWTRIRHGLNWEVEGDGRTGLTVVLTETNESEESCGEAEALLNARISPTGSVDIDRNGTWYVPAVPTVFRWADPSVERPQWAIEQLYKTLVSLVGTEETARAFGAAGLSVPGTDGAPVND